MTINIIFFIQELPIEIEIDKEQQLLIEQQQQQQQVEQQGQVFKIHLEPHQQQQVLLAIEQQDLQHQIEQLQRQQQLLQQLQQPIQILPEWKISKSSSISQTHSELTKNVQVVLKGPPQLQQQQQARLHQEQHHQERQQQQQLARDARSQKQLRQKEQSPNHKFTFPVKRMPSNEDKIKLSEAIRFIGYFQYTYGGKKGITFSLSEKMVEKYANKQQMYCMKNV